MEKLIRSWGYGCGCKNVRCGRGTMVKDAISRGDVLKSILRALFPSRHPNHPINFLVMHERESADQTTKTRTKSSSPRPTSQKDDEATLSDKETNDGHWRFHWSRRSSSLAINRIVKLCIVISNLRKLPTACSSESFSIPDWSPRWELVTLAVSQAGE